MTTTTTTTTLLCSNAAQPLVRASPWHAATAAETSGRRTRSMSSQGRPQRRPARRITATLVVCLVSSLCLSPVASRTAAANPLQVGLRAATLPFVRRLPGTTTKTTSRSPRTSSPQLVTPVSSDPEDDSVVQSAYSYARTAADLRRSRAVAYPLSRPSSADTCVAETELEHLESQACSRLVGRQSSVPLVTATPTDDVGELTHPPAEHLRGGTAALKKTTPRPLVFWENMICGAISRTIAQTTMHPANTMKTILQSHRGPTGPLVAELLKPSSFRRLTRGAGANFLLSVPNGAVNFAVLELVRQRMGILVQKTPWLEERQDALAPGLDFLSSALSTITCSAVSTPQMMVSDNIMAGNYPHLVAATKGLYGNGGVAAFYKGWWPGLVGKIPSYALTWTLFQQLKEVRSRWSHRPATNFENSIMGCVASATTVCIMIPMDTIKTRLVTQAGTAVVAGSVPYKGIIDCAVRVFREEGLATFYRGLPPRLVSVVPMIGIQFTVYEAMKRFMLSRHQPVAGGKKAQQAIVEEDAIQRDHVFTEAAIQAGASHGNPMPTPHLPEADFVQAAKDKAHRAAKKVLDRKHKAFQH